MIMKEFKRRKELISIIILINTIIVTVGASKSWTCTTPYNEPGQCVPIKECPKIWEISFVAPRPLTIQIMNYLRDSVCGNPYDRTVCCRNQDVSTAYTIQQNVDDLSQHRNIGLLDQVNCGESQKRRASEGRVTSLYEFRWMALLGYEDQGTDGPEWRCSGTVINKR